MNTLKSLTFVATPPKSLNNPTAYRRERLVQRLQEQLQLAKNPSFAPVLTRWTKGDDGVKRPVEHHRRIKPWWRVDDSGFVVLTVRHGFKTLEFEKGKGAIAVGTMDKLEGVLATLITATRAGELDGLLELTKRIGTMKGKKAA